MQFEITRLSSKGQFVIPGKVRKLLGLRTGTKLAMFHDGEGAARLLRRGYRDGGEIGARRFRARLRPNDVLLNSRHGFPFIAGHPAGAYGETWGQINIYPCPFF